MLAFASLCIYAILISARDSYALNVPSKHAVGFAGDPSINAVGIFNAAKASLKAGKDVLAMFPSTQGVPNNVDVIFGNQVPSGVGQHTIDIATLKTLGDKETKMLAAALGV